MQVKCTKFVPSKRNGKTEFVVEFETLFYFVDQAVEVLVKHGNVHTWDNEERMFIGPNGASYVVSGDDSDIVAIVKCLRKEHGVSVA